MQEIEAELRGRLVMLETLLAVAIAKLAGAGTGADPAGTIAAIMANAETMLERACAAAPAEDQQAADYARAAFEELGQAMQEHIARIAKPAGSA